MQRAKRGVSVYKCMDILGVPGKGPYFSDKAAAIVYFYTENLGGAITMFEKDLVDDMEPSLYNENYVITGSKIVLEEYTITKPLDYVDLDLQFNNRCEETPNIIGEIEFEVEMKPKIEGMTLLEHIKYIPKEYNLEKFLGMYFCDTELQLRFKHRWIIDWENVMRYDINNKSDSYELWEKISSNITRIAREYNFSKRTGLWRSHIDDVITKAKSMEDFREVCYTSEVYITECKTNSVYETIMKTFLQPSSYFYDEFPGQEKNMIGYPKPDKSYWMINSIFTLEDYGLVSYETMVRLNSFHSLTQLVLAYCRKNNSESKSLSSNSVLEIDSQNFDMEPFLVIDSYRHMASYLFLYNAETRFDIKIKKANSLVSKISVIYDPKYVGEEDIPSKSYCIISVVVYNDELFDNKTLDMLRTDISYNGLPKLKIVIKGNYYAIVPISVDDHWMTYIWMANLLRSLVLDTKIDEIITFLNP